MAYRIEPRGRQYVVIDDDTGRECGIYRLRPAAVEAIETLGREVKAAAPKAGKSRSSQYREMNTPGTALHALRKIFPRKRDITRSTEKAYYEAPIWGGLDPATVKQHHQRLMHNLKVKAATSKASAAKQNRDSAAGRGSVLREQALALIAAGEGTRAIADKLDVSDSYVRRLRRQP